MRTRKEIEEEKWVAKNGTGDGVAMVKNQGLILETLLDIRDLLSQEKPHTPVSEKAGVPIGCCKDCAYYLGYKDDWQCNGGVVSAKCNCHPEVPKHLTGSSN